MNPQDAFSTFPPAFPRPDWDEATLTRVVERRARLQAGCPRHDATPALTFYKELFIGDGDDDVHLPTMAMYADGCQANWRLDVADEEEPTYSAAPESMR